jgi:hypothetical protein
MTQPMPKKIMIPFEDFEVAQEERCGFCLACGAMKDGCEPDARNYQCDECGAMEVFGAEELLLMGRVEGRAP